jgi:NAD(P)-dependent dehydrogenase (short-subunit alcohol dehydrogenase family)
VSGVAVVTGASRGIGAAAARLLGAQGYAVCVNFLAAGEKAEAVVDDITRAGGTAIAVRADTSVEADVVRLFETVDNELGPLTALVNNAGITGGFRRVEEVDAALLRSVLDVNVTGYFLCAREAVRRMSTKHGGRGGSIVNVSSAASWTGSPDEWIHYAASKGATDTLTIGLAREVAGEGIRVNAVNPGLIDTDIHAAAGEPDRLTRMAPSFPMGRGGSPEEVAQAILFLTSDASSFTTGALFPVSGGR